MSRFLPNNPPNSNVPKSNPLKPNGIDPATLAKGIESLVDWVVTSDAGKVKATMDRLRQQHPNHTKRQLAQTLIAQQSLTNGLWGALAGLGGFMAMPAVLPMDLAKAWRIQAYTIKSIAYLYDDLPECQEDLKTDIFLLLSNQSLQEIKVFVTQESARIRSQGLGQPALPSGAIVSPQRIPARRLAASRETTSLVSQHIKPALWEAAKRKMIERVVHKSLSKAIPIVGAFLGGGYDYMTTQAVGKLAIDYFEHLGPHMIGQIFAVYAQPDPNPSLPRPSLTTQLDDAQSP